VALLTNDSNLEDARGMQIYCRKCCWSSWLACFFSLPYFSFTFFCLFWPLKRRSIMAGNSGRDKKRKCSRKK